MTSFLQFINEANTAGSKFERKVANAVNRWIKCNNLQNKFKAKRFQKITEDNNDIKSSGNRDEDYSDVIVENLNTGDTFFIECKSSIKDNIITTQFDITEDFKLIPVKGVSREQSYNQLELKLAEDLEATEEFDKFVQFLQEPSNMLDKSHTPADYYFDRVQANDKTISKLINLYNKMIDNGKTEADCKKFDIKLVRESTRNMLVIALLWRIKFSNTWDICCAKDIPYFGEMVVDHYINGKAEAAKYLQIGDNLFLSTVNDNPLNINCPEFPEKLSGKFYLKFTPRFGTGSIYITPRSSVTDDISSKCSFISKDKWPIQI